MTRKRAVVQALQHLEKHAETATRGASQPTAPVIALTGDVNLPKWCCDPLVQEYGGPQSVQTQWQVKTSNAQLPGDVLFIKGADGVQLDVSVGASYPNDRGIRNDQHDFFGAELSIPMCDVGSPRGKRPAPAGGASQPASKGCRRHVHFEPPGGQATARRP